MFSVCVLVVYNNGDCIINSLKCINKPKDAVIAARFLKRKPVRWNQKINYYFDRIVPNFIVRLMYKNLIDMIKEKCVELSKNFILSTSQNE